MRLSKDATPINVVCPKEVRETELLDDLSVQTDFCYISEVSHKNAEFAYTEQFPVILSCPHQTQNPLRRVKALPS